MTNSEAAKGPWWLALRVIDEPGAVFRQLAAQPKALIPVLLLVLVAAVVGFGTPAAALRNQAETQVRMMQQRAPDFTEEDRARMLERASSMTNRLILFAGGSAAGLISLALVALVLQLIFGTMTAAPIKFKDEFAIATHAYMPQLAGAVLIVAVMAATGMEQLRLTLGFLFDEESTPFLSNLGNQFTFFGAWNVYLLALGNQIRTQAKGIGTPLAIVGGLWILVNLGLAALSSVLGGLAG